MPHTREQVIQMGLTILPTQHTMKRRALWHDYYLPGRYGITIHLISDEEGKVDSSILLGTIEGTCAIAKTQANGTDHPLWPHINLSELGMFIEHRIKHISEQKNYENVSVINYSIMPTHLHLTIEIAKELPIVTKRGRPLQLTLGHMVGYFKSGCTSLYNRWLQGEFAPFTPGSPEWIAQADLPYDQRPPRPASLPAAPQCAPQAASISQPALTPQCAPQAASISQPALTPQCAPQSTEGVSVSSDTSVSPLPAAPHTHPYRPLWEPNYNDKILNTTRKLAEWVYYVVMNAYYWRLRDEYPHLFEHRLHLNMCMKEGYVVDMSAYGCMFLLRKGDRINVMCHRLATKDMLTPDEWTHYSQPDVAHSLEEDRRVRNLGRWDRNWLYSLSPDTKTPIPYTETAAFRKQKAELLQLAKAHTILVSPTISDGEKDIIYSALREGCPVIKLRKDPFTGKNHPSDKDRQWCARGIMLILAPWEIPPTDGSSASVIPADTKYAQFHNLNALALRMCDEIANLRMIKLYKE